MSRLRRLLPTGRFFFATTHFASRKFTVSPAERDAILLALDKTRSRRSGVVCAYVIMPTHVHLLFAPSLDDEYSHFLREFKIRAARKGLNARANVADPLWQTRSFDRVIRHRREFSKTLDYIHQNPVTAGMVSSSGEWRWSSWLGRQSEGRTPPIPIDRVELPIEEYAPLAW